VSRGVVLAWLVGMGIIGWRDVAKNHAPPMPGQLAGASGLFALLAVLSTYEPAALLAALIAWGFDVAALLQILPAGIGGTPAAAGGTAGAAAQPASTKPTIA
jgi:hypothetical protein